MLKPVVAAHFLTGIDTFGRIHEIAHEVAPPKLAIGKNANARLLLTGEDIADAMVFDCAKFPRRLQTRAPQEGSRVSKSFRRDQL